MKRIGLWPALLLAALTPAWGQITLEVQMDQDQFLLGEAIPVRARVTNFSGRTLQLGAAEDWLTFTVESKDGLVVPKLGEAPVAGEFELPSSKVATKRADLAPYFGLSRPGRYAIVASARVPGLDHDLTSKPCNFFLIEGSRLWEQPFGVPQSAGTNAGESRKYVLQQANYLKGPIQLYLRVTDDSGARSLRVRQIGPMVSFARPEPQVDKDSNLHLLYQFGAQRFSYTVWDPDGERIKSQIYDYTGNRPRLRADGEGNISVVGGVRHPDASDIPPSKPEETNSPPVTATQAPSQPAPTNAPTARKP
jgi:hypothetical protein